MPDKLFKERKAELERRQAEEEERKKSEENPETVGKSDNELLREIEVTIIVG